MGPCVAPTLPSWLLHLWTYFANTGVPEDRGLLEPMGWALLYNIRSVDGLAGTDLNHKDPHFVPIPTDSSMCFVSTFSYCSLAPSRPLTNLPSQLPLSRNSWIFLPLNTSPMHKVNDYVCFLELSLLGGFPELYCSMVAVHFNDPSMTQAFPRPPFPLTWFQIIPHKAIEELSERI